MKLLQVGAIRGPLLAPLRWHLLVFAMVVMLDCGEQAAQHSHCEQAAKHSHCEQASQYHHCGQAAARSSCASKESDSLQCILAVSVGWALSAFLEHLPLSAGAGLKALIYDASAACLF